MKKITELQEEQKIAREVVKKPDESGRTALSLATMAISWFETFKPFMTQNAQNQPKQG